MHSEAGNQRVSEGRRSSHERLEIGGGGGASSLVFCEKKISVRWHAGRERTEHMNFQNISHLIYKGQYIILSFFSLSYSHLTP